MYTLGINAVFHDSSACLVKDGRVIAAVEDERFTHIKHGKRPIPFTTYELPFHAIDYCLKEAGIGITDVAHVAYSYEPFSRLGKHGRGSVLSLPLEPSAHPTPEEWDHVWDPYFISSIINAPRHLASGAPHHLGRRFEGARADGPYKWHWVPHHFAHAASAFFAAPFERAAVMTIDGRGEKATTTYAVGEGTNLKQIGSVDMPHSLGILYEQMTTYLGFLHSSDEYKVMALASYGKPRYADVFRKIIRLESDGRYEIAPFDFEATFGPRRMRGGPLDERHFDIASSLQVVLEDTVVALATWLHEKTGLDHLCMAGGVALNCVMNARVRDRSPFREVWVQPAAGDAGTALGAALWVDARESGAPERRYVMEHPYLGPAYGDDEIEAFLRWTKVPYRRLESVPEATAKLLARDQILGWYQGRMEFGPRALGSRSIIASPINPAMQARLNDIKDREDFRPVAPAVLEEDASEWFKGAKSSPFMLFIYDVSEDKAARIPAVRHVDGTARIQTVSRHHNPLYYDMIKAFKDLTGVPVVTNTSFNTRGEPIVCTPRDAVECFWTSPLDALVIGSFLLEKNPEA